MIWPLVFYLVVPFALGAWVIKLIRKHGASTVDPALAALAARQPLEKRWFRAVRRDPRGLVLLGDFETQAEAVEAAYRAKEKAAEKASFLVVNDKAEVLEQVDS